MHRRFMNNRHKWFVPPTAPSGDWWIPAGTTPKVSRGAGTARPSSQAWPVTPCVWLAQPGRHPRLAVRRPATDTGTGLVWPEFVWPRPVWPPRRTRRGSRGCASSAPCHESRHVRRLASPPLTGLTADQPGAAAPGTVLPAPTGRFDPCSTRSGTVIPVIRRSTLAAA